MANFWKIVNSVIERSDIVLEVLDARLIDMTRNPEIEKKIMMKDKKLIYVINKCDLVDKDYLDKKKRELRPSIFISTKEHLGTTMLRNKILEISGQKKVIVGVLGYPNTGKSSVINVLAGKAKAKTSSMSGFTKAMQLIRADNRISLLDTPGVIPFREEDGFKHAIIGAVDPSKIKEPDYIVMELIQNLEGAIEAHYGVPNSDDPEMTIEMIAKKRNMLKKGGEPDIDTMSRMILKDWQDGRIILKQL